MAVGKTLETNKPGLASDINTMMQWGIAAAIPATEDVVAGSFYYETDTKFLRQEQNGVWVNISGADLSTADAAVGDVVAGKTFFAVGKPVKTGTMPSVAIVAANDDYPEGYHAGNVGGLSAIDADLAVGNIRKDVNIFGKVGTVEAVVTQRWSPARRTTTSLDWDLKDTVVIPATDRIIVWAQGYHQDGIPRGGYIQILVDDVQKEYAYSPGQSGADYRLNYGPTGHYTGPGGTVKCEVKTTNASTALGGRRGMYSISY